MVHGIQQPTLSNKHWNHSKLKLIFLGLFEQIRDHRNRFALKGSNLKGRPCGIGQSLWLTNCPVNFWNLWVGQKKTIFQSQRPDIFFVHSLEFFVQSFLKIGHSLISRLDKKSREWTKKLSGLWDRSIIFWTTKKKWEIDWTIGRLRDWPKPHGRLSCFFPCIFTKF